ncbi:MAG: hypothetical protein ABH878_03595 [bacterium]
MLTKREIHSLHNQLALIAGLFGICILGAIVMLIRPNWVDRIIAGLQTNRQAAVQVSQPEWEQLTSSVVDTQEYRRKTDEQKLAFLREWMQSADSLQSIPPILLSLDTDLYVKECERWLVCGTVQERRRALLFLDLADHPAAIPVLRKFARWVKRRHERNLAEYADRLLTRWDELPTGAVHETTIIQ